MSKIAFVYPGQGVQTVGMAQDFYENSVLSKEVFDKADQVLDFDIKKICFQENQEINDTEYTQAALVTTYLAITKEVESRGIKPDVAAGLSLGEYAAIAVSGGFSYEDAIKTVRQRGILMNRAVPKGEGTMAAILGMTAEQIDNIVNKMENVSVANYNCPGQIVISGSIEGINKACEQLKAAGAKRALPLKVGGAFHSPLMNPAKIELEAAINATEIHTPKCPVYQNVDALPHTDPAEIKANLVAQLTASVRWTQTVKNMIADGADEFTECGPGAVLQGLIKKIDKDANAHGIA